MHHWTLLRLGLAASSHFFLLAPSLSSYPFHNDLLSPSHFPHPLFFFFPQPLYFSTNLSFSAHFHSPTFLLAPTTPNCLCRFVGPWHAFPTVVVILVSLVCSLPPSHHLLHLSLSFNFKFPSLLTNPIPLHQHTPTPTSLISLVIPYISPPITKILILDCSI